jgi:hypothetical protein
MRRLIGLFFVATLAALPALALPAPMSEQELMDKSDLVALVRVLAVTCTSVTQDPNTGEDLPGYLAQLKVLEVKKGDAKPGEEVLVTWRPSPRTLTDRGPSTTIPAKRWSPISPNEAAGRAMPRPGGTPRATT